MDSTNPNAKLSDLNDSMATCPFHGGALKQSAAEDKEPRLVAHQLKLKFTPDTHFFLSNPMGEDFDYAAGLQFTGSGDKKRPGRVTRLLLSTGWAADYGHLRSLYHPDGLAQRTYLPFLMARSVAQRSQRFAP